MARLFQIDTINELHQLLALQRSVTRQATVELDDIIKSVCTRENHNDEEYLAAMTMLRESEMLERYAVLPTLTEHENSVELRGALHLGATFGVACFVGEVILSHLRAMANVFTKAHRTLLMVMLAEFHKPVSEDSDLVDTFMRTMRIELKDGMPEITEQERKHLLRGMLKPLAEAMALVCAQYKIIQHGEEGWELTPLGERVMMHLFDAQRFLDSVADAHKRLQGAGLAVEAGQRSSGD